MEGGNSNTNGGANNQRGGNGDGNFLFEKV
jgi:hypothetical protein